MKRRILFFLIVCFLTICLRTNLSAENISAENTQDIHKLTEDVLSDVLLKKVLKVAVYEEPPFAFRLPNGIYKGISIDIWELIAKKRGISFKYIPVSKEEGTKGLSQEKYDLFLGALPAFVQETGVLFEYTIPYYISGVGFAVEDKSTVTLLLDYFISWGFFKVLMFLVVFIVVQTFTIWVFERKQNPHYKKSFWKGVGNGLWWSAGIASLNEAGDVNTRTLWGRCVAIFWMFAALLMVNIFTGSLSSELTVHKLSSRVHDLRDIRNLKVVCLNDTVSKQFLEDNFIKCKSVPSIEAGLSDLEKNKAQALIYAEPILRYVMHEHPTPNVRFVSAGIIKQYYCFMVPRKSNFLFFLNQEILSLLNGQAIDRILSQYFGNEEITPQ